MPTLYVLDVPEFAPLVDAARARGCLVHSGGDYTEVCPLDDAIVLERRDAGNPRDAIWFAALTGGFSGTVVRFDESVLELRE